MQNFILKMLIPSFIFIIKAIHLLIPSHQFNFDEGVNFFAVLFFDTDGLTLQLLTDRH